MAKLLDTFSIAVAKMSDIDKLSWGIVVFLLLVGVFLFFSPIIEKWIRSLGGDKNEVPSDPSKPKVQYIAHIDYIKKENILLKQKVAEMQKQIDNINKPIKKALSGLMHDNVLWEDAGNTFGSIDVNGSYCPKDYAVLMMEHYDKIEELKYDKLISPHDFHYRLYCPECKKNTSLVKTLRKLVVH